MIKNLRTDPSDWKSKLDFKIIGINGNEHNLLISSLEMQSIDNNLIRSNINKRNAFIVADECQNASYEQLKMLLTRIGMNSKMVLTGDIAQSDLDKRQQGGFLELINKLYDLEGVGSCKLETSDIVRNPIIGSIVNRLENVEQS